MDVSKIEQLVLPGLGTEILELITQMHNITINQ